MRFYPRSNVCVIEKGLITYLYDLAEYDPIVTHFVLHLGVIEEWSDMRTTLLEAMIWLLDSKLNSLAKLIQFDHTIGGSVEYDEDWLKFSIEYRTT